MVIDYVFVGFVGFVADADAPQTSVLGVAQRHAPYPIVSAEDAVSSAHPVSGLRHAVARWGSDHLPVACDLSPSPLTGGEHSPQSHGSARAEAEREHTKGAGHGSSPYQLPSSSLVLSLTAAVAIAVVIAGAIRGGTFSRR